MAGRAEFWAGHIEAQRGDGRSQRAYCEQHGLRPRTFRRWALRLQRRGEAVAAALDTAPEATASPGAGARTSTGTEEVLLPGPVAEILTSPELRRRWTEEQKLRLVAETFRPGASISAVARRHGVHSSVLFRWRRRFTEPVPTEEPTPATMTPATITAPGFVPVRVVADAPEPAPSSPPAPASMPASAAGLIEIELARGQRVRVDRHVDADALRRVLAVLAAGDAP